MLYAGIRCRGKEEVEGYESEDESDEMEYVRQGKSDDEELEGNDGEEVIVIDDDEVGERKVDEADVDSGSEKMEVVRKCVEKEDGSLGDEYVLTVRDVKDVAEKNQENS